MFSRSRNSRPPLSSDTLMTHYEMQLRSRALDSADTGIHLPGPSSAPATTVPTQLPSTDEGWTCRLCTLVNSPTAFKCAVCKTSKGTASRKPQLNWQVAQQQQVLLPPGQPSTSAPAATAFTDSKTDTELTSAQKERIARNRQQALNIRNERLRAQSRTAIPSSVLPSVEETSPASPDSFHRAIDVAYSEVVFWSRNLFPLPNTSCGRIYIRETLKFLNGFTEGHPLESIAMKAVSVMPFLLLQRPHSKSTTAEHKEHLARRLLLWQAGNVSSLLKEARCVQRHYQKQRRHVGTDITRHFTNLMLAGKVNAAQ